MIKKAKIKNIVLHDQLPINVAGYIISDKDVIFIHQDALGVVIETMTPEPKIMFIPWSGIRCVEIANENKISD